MIDRYLVGNRVYRHGSHAPTMGTVDPTGYVERELRKRMLDPISQTRSGLASAALQRLQGNRTTGLMPPRTVTPTRQIQPYQPTPVQFQPGGTAPVGVGGNTALNAKLAAVKAQHYAEQQQQLAAAKAKQAARPKVSSTGKVTPAKPTALPFDMEAQTEKINAADTLGQLRNMILAQRQQAESQYSAGQHELDMQQPQQERSLLNNFGSRGLAFGSGYGVGLGNLENALAGQRAGLDQAHTGTLADLLRQENQGNDTYQRRLATIQQALAERLSKRAGTLGFGPATLPKPKPVAKKKVKK